MVNNVETLASVPPIVLHGGEWYQGLGVGSALGSYVSGHTTRPRTLFGACQVATVLGIARKTVEADWYFARAWLHTRLLID